MDHYRDVARSVWNAGFWVQADLQTWDARSQFEQIKKLLFKALVIARLQEGHCCDLKSLPDDRIFQVVPNTGGLAHIMVQRSRDGDGSRYWDDPVDQVKASEAEMHFLDYFDWNNMSYADFQYYRVRIAAFPGQPHLVGREALISHSHAKVIVDSPSKE